MNETLKAGQGRRTEWGNESFHLKNMPLNKNSVAMNLYMSILLRAINDKATTGILGKKITNLASL